MNRVDSLSRVMAGNEEEIKRRAEANKINAAVVKKFPDAGRTIIENGRTVFVDDTINLSNYPNAKRNVLLDNAGRFVIRYSINGPMKQEIYSSQRVAISDAKTAKMLEEYLKCNSGRSFFQKLQEEV